MTTHRTGRPRTSKTAPPAAGYRAPMYRVEPQAEPSGPLARTCGYAVIVLAPLVLLSVLAAIICYVRLLHGPVSLKAFNERIEQGISAELGGFRARIDDAILTLGDNWRVELRLTNLRITEPDGDLVASAPLAAVDLDPGSLLWMNVSPQRVFFIEPRLSLFYSAAVGPRHELLADDDRRRTPLRRRMRHACRSRRCAFRAANDRHRQDQRSEPATIIPSRGPRARHRRDVLVCASRRSRDIASQGDRRPQCDGRSRLRRNAKRAQRRRGRHRPGGGRHLRRGVDQLRPRPMDDLPPHRRTRRPTL